MCYSAQIKADYQKLVREYGAIMSLAQFAELYAFDPGKARPKTPKALDDAFAAGATPDELRIWGDIEHWNKLAASKWESELFTQTSRLNTAARALQVKVTKKAQEDVRIATNKIANAREKLDDLRRAELLPRDSRIFPGVYAPVILVQRGAATLSYILALGRAPTCTPSRRSACAALISSPSAMPEASAAIAFAAESAERIADLTTSHTGTLTYWWK